MFSNNEVKGCKKKKRFSNSVAAQAALNKVNPSRSLSKPNRIYRCPVCGGWHLTSKPKI